MRFLNVGAEAIAFQNSSTADYIEKLFDQILTLRSGEAADKSEEAKALNKYIKSTTNLNVDIIFNTENPPCTLPFHINPDTILGHNVIKEYYAEDATATLKRLKNEAKDSYVDLKNAKVGGLFTKPQVPIWMSFNFIKYSKMTPRELAAILAHEVGHCFVAFEMAFRVVRTNQVLSSVAKASAGGDQGEYKYVLKLSEEVLGLKTGVFDQVVEVKDTKTVMSVVLGVPNDNTYNKSLMGNTTYDVTTFEAMADNFAARLGLGRDLVTGLEKLHRQFGSTEYSFMTRWAVTIVDTTVLAQLCMAPLMIMTGPIGLLIGPFVFLMSIGYIWASLEGRDHNNVYDKLSIRFKRIKEQLITYIKDRKIDKKEIASTIENIEMMEKKIGEISEYKGYVPIIFGLFSPATHKLKSARELQSQLETLAANDLFVKAAKFELLK